MHSEKFNKLTGNRRHYGTMNLDTVLQTLLVQSALLDRSLAQKMMARLPLFSLRVR